MIEAALILTGAFALDLLFGDPVYPLHPVRLIGAAVTAVKKSLRRLGLTGVVGGIVLVLAVGVSAVTAALWLQRVLCLLHSWAGGLFAAFIAYSCLSLTDLIRHAERVGAALDAGDLFLARQAVQAMVGRDASILDTAGIGRAAIESAAENVVDGVLSPLFWYAAGAWIAQVFGICPAAGALAGILGHRVVNTLDAMVGYRNRRYWFLGCPAARLDDIMNFIPARLSIPVIFLAALLGGDDGPGCLRCGLRDRHKHASPNSAHAESAVAGALGLRLGGPTIYPHGLLEKPWLGDGHAIATTAHIHLACRLIFRTGLIAAFLTLAFLTIPLLVTWVKHGL